MAMLILMMMMTFKSSTFSCDKCEYSSHLKSHLTNHVKTSHKSEPKVLKRKRTSDNLPNRKKTKEEKFNCDECQFKSKSKKTLKQHKETSCQGNVD